MGKRKLKSQMAAYELFHCSDDFYLFWRLNRDMPVEQIRRAFLEGFYQLVHTFVRPQENVEAELEWIFHDSQNLDEIWRLDDPCRSTSVVRVGNDYWIVAKVGFDRLWTDS
jgi:hypothetical protein